MLILNFETSIMHSKQRFQNNYDFLRVFAALAITFFQSFALLNRLPEEPLIKVSNGRINFSFIGLNIFFCISGYLIAKSASTSPTLKNYLWKRLLRIQPLLIVTCICTVFLLGPLFTDLSASHYFLNVHTWTYFRNILPFFGLQFSLPGVFVKNIAENGVNGSLWTLIVEERLYLLMCFLFLFKKQYSSYVSFYILFLNLIYLFNRFYYSGDLIPYFNTSAFYYSLVFLNSAALFILKIKFSKNLFLFACLSSVGVLAAIMLPAFDFIYLFSFPFFVNSIARIKGITNYAGKYGDFTYGIYIFSFPIQQMFIAKEIALKNPYLLFLLTILIVIPMAILSWNLVEKRFLRLKKIVK
jgi:peptidoglycan/LPS O-acetylase OafA/YrhL